MRISRPCYDKYHRCPGWAGGGTRYAKVQRCDGGSIGAAYSRRAWKWRPARCPKCSVFVLPYMVRWLDWRYWRWQRERPGRTLAVILFHIPPVTLMTWLDSHLPGFRDGYEDAYNRWEVRENRKTREQDSEENSHE